MEPWLILIQANVGKTLGLLTVEVWLSLSMLSLLLIFSVDVSSPELGLIMKKRTKVYSGAFLVPIS